MKNTFIDFLIKRLTPVATNVRKIEAQYAD